MAQHNTQVPLSSRVFPFRVALKSGESLELLAAVRDLPGRRLVCRGLWRGRPVYAKIFFGRKSLRNAVRDASGVRAMIETGIDTPALLLEDQVLDGGGEVLIFAEVERSRDAETVCHSLAHDPAARFDLARALVGIVAAHHRAGVIQHDMYLKNFLVTETGILTLDGDGVRRQSSPVGRRAGLDNLALLLSKFYAEDDDWHPALLESYAADRGLELRAAELRQFSNRVMAHRQRVARHYADHKVFRSCSDVVVEHDWHRFLAITRDQDGGDLRALLASMDAEQVAQAAEILKKGKTCTVYTLQMGQRKVVVKRYNIKNLRHAFGRAWRPSRAAASWANSYRMGILGIPVAQPVAFLEQRWGPLRRQAYFVAEHVPAPSATKFFADDSVPLERKHRAAHHIARLLRKLWCLGLVHGDMKSTNLLVTATDEPVLLDLDSLSEVRCRWRLKRGHGRDLQRWMENWRSLPEVDDMMRRTLLETYQDAALLRSFGLEF